MAYVSTPIEKEICISSIVTIHYFEYSKDFVFHGESHDFWELLYVDKGTLIVQTDERFHTLSAGDIIFHKPNEFHAMKAQEEKAPNLVVVSFICTSSSIQFFNEKAFTLSFEERKMISQIIAEAKNAFSTSLHIPTVEKVEPYSDAPFGSQQLVGAYLELLLISLRRNHEKNTSLPSVTQSLETLSMNLPAHSERLKQIIEFMKLNLCEHLTIGRICKEFSISRSTLQALFHKEKNCGAMEYFNFMKIKHAKEIMRDSKMNLTEVAHYLSYSSLQYFSKQFKNATGMSPLEYITSVKGLSQAVEKSAPKKDLL